MCRERRFAVPVAADADVPVKEHTLPLEWVISESLATRSTVVWTVAAMVRTVAQPLALVSVHVAVGVGVERVNGSRQII